MKTSALRSGCLAAVAVLLAAGGAAAQTVRVADLRPRQRQVAIHPAQRMVLTVDRVALQGYGGVAGVRFRLVRKDLTDVPLSTNGAVCLSVPTRTLSARVTGSGALDFGPVFNQGDLGLVGGQLEESHFYLVAEVAGMPGDDLLLSGVDLRRYVVRGIRIVVPAPTGPPSRAQVNKIKSRLREERRPKPSAARCWTVG